MGDKTIIFRLIDAGLWDVIRVETAPRLVFRGTPAPKMPPVDNPAKVRTDSRQYDGNTIFTYEKLL